MPSLKIRLDKKMNTPNISSGHTDKLNQMAARCFKPAFIETTSCSKTPPGPLTVQLPSLLLTSKACPPPSAADFALYPKVAVASSVRTESLAAPACAVLPDPKSRFSHYRRFQPAAPCQALPQSANMAGISKPSTRQCNTTK